MGIANKFKTFFFLDEEEAQYEDEQRTEKQPVETRPKKEKNKFQAVEKESKVVSMQGAQYSSRMVLVEPRVYAEAQELADYLKDYRSVVVNLQRINRDQAVRIVDFLSGTVYALGGDIQRIGNNIFLCTPENVEVDGAISEMLEEQNFM